MIRVLLVLILLTGTAMAQPFDAVRALAPTGPLRAAINFGNPVLAQRGPAGEPRGVSVALATELARRLGVRLEIVPFEGAGKVTDALGLGVWDVAFLARDPVRGQGIAFTEPYVLIEGGYAVRVAAAFHTTASVDTAGTQVAVAKGSAYDLYLTRALQHATLVRLATGSDAAAAFLDGAHDALAGVKQPLAVLVAQHSDTLRLLPGRFMSIEQTMGTPRDRVPAALDMLQSFITEMKSSGFVANALAESGQRDAEVAP